MIIPSRYYDIEAVAAFDDTINNGMAAFVPGDYIFEYNVTVKKQQEGA